MKFVARRSSSSLRFEKKRLDQVCIPGSARNTFFDFGHGQAGGNRRIRTVSVQLRMAPARHILSAGPARHRSGIYAGHPAHRQFLPEAVVLGQRGDAGRVLGFPGVSPAGRESRQLPLFRRMGGSQPRPVAAEKRGFAGAVNPGSRDRAFPHPSQTLVARRSDRRAAGGRTDRFAA